MIVDSKMHALAAACEYDRAGRMFSSIKAMLIVKKLKTWMKQLLVLACPMISVVMGGGVCGASHLI